MGCGHCQFQCRKEACTPTCLEFSFGRGFGFTSAHSSIQYTGQHTLHHSDVILYITGQNLILNMNDHGLVVCAYNRTVAKVDHFSENEAKGHLHVSYSKYRGFASGLFAEGK